MCHSYKKTFHLQKPEIQWTTLLCYSHWTTSYFKIQTMH